MLDCAAGQVKGVRDSLQTLKRKNSTLFRAFLLYSFMLTIKKKKKRTDTDLKIINQIYFNQESLILRVIENEKKKNSSSRLDWF